MKKSNLLFAAFCICAIATNAQPILQMNAIPNIGDVTTFHVADPTGISEGNAGANQTWDLSALQDLDGVTPFLYEYLAPANTPYASSFPGANFVTKINEDPVVYVYHQKESNQLFTLGAKNTEFDLQYPDPDLVMDAPLAFNGSFQDNFTSILDAGTGALVYGRASRTVTYDGYGTLITPAGTFPNAVRLKSISMQVDSTNFFGTMIINYTDITTYNWMAPNTPGPLASVYYTHTVSHTILPGIDTIISDLGVVKSANFIDNLTTAAPEPSEQLSGVSIQLTGPNPVADQLRATIFTEKSGLDVQLLLTDMQGKPLEARSFETAPGETQILFPVGHLPAGTYLLTLTDGRDVQALRWVKL
ncbi:MAG: T9SS type A sorting domain-containing protein [Saprospiraceae bacterium]|nr:T9SS type A sorting domain-containing protein [Lewinellaceae bacterium]